MSLMWRSVLLRSAWWSARNLSSFRQQVLADLTSVLTFGYTAEDGEYLSNQSKALALDICAYVGTLPDDTRALEVNLTILGGGSRTAIGDIQWQANAPTPAWMRYRSQDGRWILTEIDDLRSDSPVQRTVIDL